MPMTDFGGKLALRELFKRLEDRNLLRPEKRELALKVLASQRAELLQSITILTAIGAWLAAVAFSLFVIEFIRPKGSGGIVMGLGYCFGATLLRRIARHDFFVQAALAFLLAGYAIVLVSVPDTLGYGLSDSGKWEWATCGAAVLLAAVLYVVYDYPLQRFVVPAFASIIVIVTVIGEVCFEALSGLVLVEALGLLFIFAGPTRRTGLRPLGLALAVALALTVAPLTVPQLEPLGRSLDPATNWTVRWHCQALLAAALLWLAWWAGRQAQPEAAGVRRPPVFLAFVTIVLLGILSSPGILAGLFLAALGHATRERIVASLGLLALTCSIAWYFCDYDLTLSARAGALAASGLVLLAARFVLWRAGARKVAE